MITRQNSFIQYIFHNARFSIQLVAVENHSVLCKAKLDLQDLIYISLKTWILRLYIHCLTHSRKTSLHHRVFHNVIIRMQLITVVKSQHTLHSETWCVKEYFGLRTLPSFIFSFMHSIIPHQTYFYHCVLENAIFSMQLIADVKSQHTLHSET